MKNVNKVWIKYRFLKLLHVAQHSRHISKVQTTFKSITGDWNARRR